MARIAVVEDHRLIAETLRLALTAAGHDVLVPPAQEPDQLRDVLLAEAPDLVLLDLDLGAFGDTTGLIAPLTRAGVRVLVVSGTADRERVGLAFEAGAVDFHAKADGFDLLLDKAAGAVQPAAAPVSQVRTVMLADLVAIRSARATAHAPFERLTLRERDVLLALSTGRSVHDIAADLVLSEATVRTHVRGILSKLGAPSQLAAVAMATRTGWLAGLTADSAVSGG